MPEHLPSTRDLPVRRYVASNDALVAAVVEGPSLRQTWRSEPEDGLLPSYLGLQWTPSALIVQALLVDAEVITSATRDGQRLWELGDTFEIFLGDLGSPAYSEFHLSPNGFKLALRFSGPEDVAESRRTGDIGPFSASADVFQGQAGAADGFPGWKIEGEAGGWYVFASIPCEAITGRGRIEPGEIWEGHFARYDYSSSQRHPVLSSTAPLSALDFHRRPDWNRLVFQD